MIDDEVNEKSNKNEDESFTDEASDLPIKDDLNKLNCDDNPNNNNNGNNLTQQHAHQQQQQQISQQQQQQFHQQQRQQINSPIENRYLIDKDGLMLALKYFQSSTLTMRLSGIAQINNTISMFNEYLQAENTISSLRHSEGEQFVEWILSNRIIEHIFGPNLHVEVIKQSQIILNFVVAHLTPEQIDVIWSASQLKHCSKQVFDILMPLIKNMNIPAVLHLYGLLKHLDVREHTEQTLCLASYLLKFIWSKSFNISEPVSGNGRQQLSALDSVAIKKNYINMLVNPNFELLKEVSDDSSVSASMVEDTSDEEDSTCFLREQQQQQQLIGNNAGNSRQPPPPITDLGDSVSSCASLDDENSLVIKQPAEDSANLAATSEDPEVFKTQRANCSQLTSKQQLKSHRQVFAAQQAPPEPPAQQHQQPPAQFAVQQQPNFEAHQSALTANYLEKKCLDIDSDSGSEFEAEISDYKSAIRKEQRKQRQREKFDYLKKARQQLKIADEEDEEMFDSDEHATDGHILARMIRMRKNKNAPKNLVPPGDDINSILSDSNSSNFSEKNMADFDCEESDGSAGSDQELTDEKVIDAQRHHFSQNYVEMSSIRNKYLANSLINLNNLQQQQQNSSTNQTSTSSLNSSSALNGNSYESEVTAELVKFSLENVCKPGQTLLWDLLHDDSIRHLSGDLALNCEKILFSLICCLSDKRLRMKFIEGCMNNISQNRSVIISLRLLPKLLMSFDQQRGKNEIHALTMMVEQERNLLNDFFSNLVQYTERFQHYSKLKSLEREEAGVAHKIRKTSESQDKSTAVCSNPCVSRVQSNQPVNVQQPQPPPPPPPPPSQQKPNSQTGQTDQIEQQQPVDTSSSMLISYEQTSYEFFTNVLYSHLEEVQTRLQFLSIIFSSTCSPELFQLSQEQIDILWYCLAYDLECRDELFSWLLNQVRTKEQHALSNEMLEYILERKMPTLTPESYTTTALDLLQSLSNNIFFRKQHELFINRKLIVDQAINSQKSQQQLDKASQPQPLILSLNKSQIDQLNSTDNDQWKIASIAIKQLWNIALKAVNTDVSMAAIRNLNNYYVHLQSAKTLDKEEEFIKQCMDYLTSSSRSLREDEEKHLTVIQRALVLLKTHLETFRCRYSYHFRLMQLSGDQSITSHRNKLNERSPQQSIKIICQISSLSEKFIFEMNCNDYVGELRAEVTNRWSKLIASIKPELIGNKINLNADGPIRLLSQGQEITYNLDEKTLVEMNFKDGQVVYLTTGAIKQARRKDTIETKLPDPPKNKLPSILLLDPVYFDQLFALLQQLGSMKETFCAGRAQVLSRRVWEIINLLPTSPNLMKCFRNICLIKKDEESCNKESSASSNLPSLISLLDPKSPQKLIYSLQIVDYLQKTKDEDINSENCCWLKYFVDYGGLNHLFDIFISGALQQGESNNWNEWKQDCLASLLQLIYQIGINSSLSDSEDDKTSTESAGGASDSQQAINSSQSSAFQANNNKRKKPNRMNDKLVVQQFNKQFLSMLNDVDQVLSVLLTILSETCSLSKSEIVYYQTGFWGRSQIVHHTFTFLTSWLFSDSATHINLFNDQLFKDLLKRLVLEDSDPAVRREVCTCLYRLSLGNSKNVKIGFIFIPHLLNHLLAYLPIAQLMKPYKNQAQDEICYIEKESFGPGCKDYFWLIYTLVDSLEPQMIGNDDGKVNLEKLCVYLANVIESLDIRETRNLNVEDESLRGLLCLMTVSLKHNLAYKKSDDCKTFLYVIFDCLFAHPNAKDRNLPKCKQQSTRSAAFDLLLEIIRGCEENQAILIKLLYKQHTATSHNTYNWDYWPHDDCRSDCGYVGLINLGATCYMASCVQHLFMFPKVRKVILASKITKSTKNAAILCELQRMFAFLLESERKAYNPKNFCKVYTIENQPLNTGEQKDMTEFFTDLISKLEEMSGELKNTLRELFAGTLSNNVVSLDCPHISQTTEEFNNLRCKVADMRNLYDSLDELTVKDTLEGDNMYTCSQCGKKVRAEKRACIKKLPEILCLNTLRYTFNMVTMTKEKVNTHFSFPMRIDLSPYLEENLIRNDDKQATGQKKSGQEVSSDLSTSSDFQSASSQPPEPAPEPSDQQQSNSRKRSRDESMNASTSTASSSELESNQYELIGVTVHTGTADGGHYYCFIREPDPSKDKWYIFNDAEVHAFDPSQLAAECFGGEMTSKTYDSVNDKFMDFAIEKTNSAYMLFYKRIANNLWASSSSTSKSDLSESQNSTQSIKSMALLANKPAACGKQYSANSEYEIPKELNDFIWEDNIQFIKDKYIFEHTYFNFMWQVCAFIPQTINNSQIIQLPCAQLATAFVIETLIHSKEKPTIANWIELLTKQFNASLLACEWLIDHIAENHMHWPVQILFKCPNQMVRQLFQRLCVHVITELKKSQQNFYLKPYSPLDDRALDEDASNEMKLSSLESASTSMSSVVKLDAMQSVESFESALPNYGRLSCVTRLIRKLLLLLKCNNPVVRPHLKHLTEYFNLLYEFTKMGDIEVEFMLKMEAISIIVQFYLSHCKANGEILEVISDDEEDLSEFDDDQNPQLDQIVNCGGPSTSNSSPNFNLYRNNQLIGLAQSFKELQQEKYAKPASLDKMISFLAFLVDKSRNANGKLCISANDMEALVGKNFLFFHRSIRDNINLRQIFNLICTLCLNNEKMSTLIINMILTSINRQPEISQPFFIILSMLVELSNTGNSQQQQQQQSQQPTISPTTAAQQQPIPSSIHSFSNNIYPKIWEIAEQNPLHTLEWLTNQVPRNVNLHNIILKDLDKWMEYFLIAHNNQRVRQATTILITSLVPNNMFRTQSYKSHKTMILQNKENLELTEEAIQIVRKIFSNLLGLLKVARQYVEIQTHGTSKLTSYFTLMFYCLLGKKEKLMLVPYFNDLWNLFQPKLSEPPIPINQNKQALLYFWHQACLDCPENVQCIVQNGQVTKNIAFNYILADHDDQDVILFNRIMLPSYYGLLNLCCAQSRSFTRQLSSHQNMSWAFKNITPYYTQYQNAANELFKLMRQFVATFPDSTAEEQVDIKRFKFSTIELYLGSIDPRSCWTTTITAFSILLETDEDRMHAILNNAIISLFQSFSILFMMFHEATACHITNEIVDILRILSSLLSTLRRNLDQQPKLQEYHSKWKDHSEFVKKPIHLLNTFTPTEVRLACMDFLVELIQLFPKECIPVTVQMLGLCHLSFQEQFMNFQPGPYYPRLGQNPNLSKSSLRPTRPTIQMNFHPKILQAPFGKDRAYDSNVKDYYLPYHNFIASLCRIANDHHIVNQELVGFCSMVANESLSMRMIVFPKLWFDLMSSTACEQQRNVDDFIGLLCNSCNYFREYISLILLQDKDFLQYDIVFELIRHCLPMINPPLVTPQFITKMISMDCSINLNLEEEHFVKNYIEMIGYLRSFLAIFSTETTSQLLTDEHKTALRALKTKLTNFSLESGSSSSDIEMPQKRRKTSEEPMDDTAGEKQQPIIKQLENCSAKVESANNLQKQKNDLKALISRTISELLKALEFDSS